MAADENKHPNAVDATSKEAVLGRRLYSKAVEPTLAELHAQTSNMAKREALGKLSDALAQLDSVDPEGAYHLLRNLNNAISQDAKLSSAFLPNTGRDSAKGFIDPETPLGTVIIKSQTPSSQQHQQQQPSPTKLVLASNNPHLKSHKRRQESVAVTSTGSPEKAKREDNSKIDPEKAAIMAKYPGRDPEPGMEHCKQLTDVLYARWVNNLRNRWPNV